MQTLLQRRSERDRNIDICYTDSQQLHGILYPSVRTIFEDTSNTIMCLVSTVALSRVSNLIYLITRISSLLKHSQIYLLESCRSREELKIQVTALFSQLRWRERDSFLSRLHPHVPMATRKELRDMQVAKYVRCCITKELPVALHHLTTLLQNYNTRQNTYCKLQILLTRTLVSTRSIVKIRNSLKPDTYIISPSHFRSITVAELKANPPSDIVSLRFNVLVGKRDTDFSSFNATAGPKVSRLKITVADQSGWIKCYVSDPNLNTYRGLCQGCQDT